ncbi:hypothetical protein DH2020_038654 [Rehmannia glutinosa]|uniref:Thaumatin-like protein n=1 Tax=Rehmannia glutinosa TaxID=99300 RepID=A0ABR0UZ53_REHGL
MASSYTIVFILLLHIFQGKGSEFQVCYPNRLLSSTGSLAPSFILSTALLLDSILLQPLVVIACFFGGSHSGCPKLESTGFELPKGNSRAFQAPTGWSGRFWGRTGCTFDDSGHGSCATGDCGSGQMECNGAGATAATLVEFTLGSGSMDFYDVSLVDGYNLPVMVDVTGGSGQCVSTGCVEDLNQRCPAELRTEDGGACRSACDAFSTPEYCCKGEYGSPATCRPSMYSQMFKSACPKSYSYAYDDATSTFTCTAADYVITFCPSLPSQKSSKSDNGTMDGSGSDSGSESDSGRVRVGSGGDVGRWVMVSRIGNWGLNYNTLFQLHFPNIGIVNCVCTSRCSSSTPAIVIHKCPIRENKSEKKRGYK